MRIIVLFLVLLLISCEARLDRQIDVKRIPQSEVNTPLSRSIAKLGEQINAIDTEGVLRRLGEHEEVEFLERVKELKEKYNQLIIQWEEIGKKDTLELKEQYQRLQTIMDYIIKNYKV